MDKYREVKSIEKSIEKRNENNKLIKVSVELISFVIWLTGGVLITLGVILLQLFMVDYFFIKSLIYLISILNILIGCVLFVCGILAFYYAIRKHFVIGGIVFYILILTALSILILIVLGVVLYKNGTIQKYSMPNLIEHFSNSTDFVDKLQTNFMCCGLNSYTEWQHNPLMNSIEPIWDIYLSQDRLSYSLPDSCCAKKEIDCAKYFPSIKLIHKRACRPVLDKLLHNLLKQMMFVSSISLVIVICSIFFISYVSLFSNGSYHILERKEKKRKDKKREENSDVNIVNNGSNVIGNEDECASSQSALLDD